MGSTKDMRPMNYTIKDIIISRQLLGCIDLYDDRYPSATCANCRYILYKSQNDESCLDSLNIYDFSTIPPVKPLTRANDQCDCLLCDSKRYVDTKSCCTSFNIRKRPKVGRPKCASVTQARPLKICTMCLSEIGRGKAHECTKSKRIDNLKGILSTNNDKTEDQVACHILKKKCVDEGSTAVSLSQSHGKPLRVEVTPPKEKENQTLRTSDMQRIKTDLNLSENKTKRLAGHLRASTRNRRCLEPGLRDALRDNSHGLDDYFSVQNIQFKGKEEPTVFCQDMQSLVDYIIDKRDLSRCDLLFKVGIDSGGDFQKICCNVIDRTNVFEEGPPKRSKYSQGVAPKAFKDTSVNKLMILALTPEKRETHNNMQLMWNTIGKYEVFKQVGTLVIAADLKMCNILTGLMSHASLHPCTWCDSCRYVDLLNIYQGSSTKISETYCKKFQTS